MSEASSNDALGAAVREELKAIWRSLRPAWSEAFGHLRKQTRFDGAKLFLCGGGSQLPGVQKIFRQAWIPNIRDFEVQRLLPPDDFDTLSGNVDFRRLAVAYGLTFLRPELGEFTLPADSPDHTPVIRYKKLPPPWGDNEPG